MLLKHLAKLLMILALLFAPAGMLSGHAAMAAPAPEASVGHCADMAGPHGEAPDDTAPAENIDCMIVCSCVPPVGTELRDAPSLAKAPDVAAVVTFAAGSNPAADPPPPRLS